MVVKNKNGRAKAISANMPTDASYNVAKIVFEFSIPISRSSLQITYGEQFGGTHKWFLPSRLVPGGGHDETEGEEATETQGPDLIRTRPVKSRGTGGCL
jgi:hypothetical protein